MLINVSTIIEKSWQLFATKWRLLLPYMGLLFVPTAALSILGMLGIYLDTWMPSSALVTNVIILAVFVASLVYSIWVTLALTITLADMESGKPVRNWQEVFNAVAPSIWPFIYSSLFAGLIVFGGTLLLIIPGIIFAVWYSFVMYAVLLRGKKGMDALAYSKQLVAGRWWSIFWCLLAPGLLFIIGSTVIRVALMVPFYFLLPDGAYMIIADNIITALVSAAVTPLASVAVILVFRSAEATPVLTLPPAAPKS